jgi:hypothetical protein
MRRYCASALLLRLSFPTAAWVHRDCGVKPRTAIYESGVSLEKITPPNKP